MSIDQQRERTAKTPWHRLLGKLLELLLTRVEITVQTEVQVMSDPPKVDILLLRRQGDRWTPQQRRLLPDGLRDSHARHLLVECKLTESVNAQSFQQALGYDYFYRQAQSLTIADVQTFVLSAHTPRPTVLQDFGYTVQLQPGVYQSTQSILKPIGLIVLNQLTAEPYNAFVQCFASQRRVRAAAFRTLENMAGEAFDELFWDYVAGLRNVVTAKGVEMSEATINTIITPELVLETGKKMRKAWLATLTPQEIRQVIARASPEERLAGLPPEERLAGLPPEERLAGLPPEKRLAGLTREEVVALLKQIEAELSRAASDQ